MEYLPIEIKNDDLVLKIEKEIIRFIYDSVKEEIPEYYGDSDDYLRYSVNTNIIIPENTDNIKEISLYTELRKDNQSTDMQGRISGHSKYINGFTDIEGSIRIIGTNVTGQISMKYGGICYSGDIKGESVCEGFTPIFTCISDLHSDSENSPIHLNCVFASTITRLCSDHNFYDELSDKYGLGVIPYSKYISGWKKIGHSYKYISPETQTSVKMPKYPALSSENVVEALQYINNDMGMLIFFHSLRSLIFRFFKPVHHAALNINCDMMIKDEAIEYISSIVDLFGSPNITRGINSENFALNREFKITDYMRNIDGMKRDSRLFKDFPVFLFGEKRKKDIYNPNTTPQPKKTKIRQPFLKSMLNSDISYMFLNADNDDENIMNFKLYYRLNQLNNNEKIIFKKLICEYIVYLENKINCTLVISSKNHKLINLHKEIFFELRYKAFDDFLSNLRSVINELTFGDYFILCRNTSYSDVIKLYEKVKYSIDCPSNDFFQTFDMSKLRNLFNIFKQDIIDKYIKKRRDRKSLEKMTIFSSYFDNLDDEEKKIDCLMNENALQKDEKELRKQLKQKFKLFKKKYYARQIVQFAGSMKYNVNYFNELQKYADDIMNLHKQECGKPTLRYCTELLAAAYGFVLFLSDKYGIPEEVGQAILKRVEGLYKPVAYNGELKVPDKALKIQLFRKFLEKCRKMAVENTEIRDWNPIYIDEAFFGIEGRNKKVPVQLIGWYNIEKSEFALIKTKDSPVEVAFKKFLKQNRYDDNFVWPTFVREQLCPAGIIKKSCQKTHPYESSRKIDGIKHIVYIMYL